jgi:hypothetical protein
MNSALKISRTSNYYSKAAIIIIAVAALINFSTVRFWNQENRVIAWDVISYYAYLPASFIHNDIYLEFLDNPAEDYSSQFWPQTTANGERVIKTTMGVAYLYIPGFVAGHFAAAVAGYEQDGFSAPYRFFMQLNGIIFLILGLFTVRRVLRKWFDERVTAITIIAITAGTNLYHYGVLESTYSHIFSFFLFALFLLLTINFYSAVAHDNTGRTYRIIAAAGFTAGLITLIRPANIIIVIIFLFWATGNLTEIKNRFRWFIIHPSLTVIMILFFILPWIPQFLYWKEVTGEWLYYSYQDEGFFFLKPHILKGLFSFRKGLFIYTPLVILMWSGIVFLRRRLSDPAVALLIFTPLNVYIIFSWWCWWYGGSLGQRPFVESYALYAIPLAALITKALEKKRWIRTAILSLLLLLSLHGIFQTFQYYYGAIHWDSMTREAWSDSFGRVKPSDRFYSLIREPDYEGARLMGKERPVH